MKNTKFFDNPRGIKIVLLPIPDRLFFVLHQSESEHLVHFHNAQKQKNRHVREEERQNIFFVP